MTSFQASGTKSVSKISVFQIVSAKETKAEKTEGKIFPTSIISFQRSALSEKILLDVTKP